MIEIGQVIKLKGHDQVLVRVERKESCGECKACAIGRKDQKFVELTVDNTLNAKVGDNIELDLDTPDLLKAAFLMYGIPLVVMIGMTMLSYYFFFPENQNIAGIIGLASTALVFIIIRFNEDKIRESEKFLPKMINIVRKDGLL